MNNYRTWPILLSCMSILLRHMAFRRLRGTGPCAASPISLLWLVVGLSMCVQRHFVLCVTHWWHTEQRASRLIAVCRHQAMSSVLHWSFPQWQYCVWGHDAGRVQLTLWKGSWCSLPGPPSSCSHTPALACRGSSQSCAPARGPGSRRHPEGSPSGPGRTRNTDTWLPCWGLYNSSGSTCVSLTPTELLFMLKYTRIKK